MGNVRHLHSDGNDDRTPHGDQGGYSYSAFGKLLRGSDPGALSGGVPLFGWQGKRVLSALQPNLYDSMARVWSADLGAFLQPDEYVYLTRTGTLWLWPGQNPFRHRDPSGRQDFSDWISAQSWIDDAAPALAEIAAVSEVPGLAQAGQAAMLGINAIDALSSLEAQRQSAAAIAKATSNEETECKDEHSKEPPELPTLDSTGKVHGQLPDAKDLGRYSPEDLEQLSEELQKSVQERIRKTNEMGSDKSHGERQADEQQLIRQIEKNLQDRQ